MVPALGQHRDIDDDAEIPRGAHARDDGASEVRERLELGMRARPDQSVDAGAGQGELPRGERAVADHGARRDLVGSLAEGLRAHIADVERLVPGAEVVVQVDEPALPAVLEGRLPTASGYGTLRAVDRSEVRDGLRAVLDAAGERTTLVHCCAGEVPVQLLRESGARGISLDTSLLDGARWEQVAEAVEAGVTLWAGAVPTSGGDWRTARDRLVGAWQRIGLPVSALADVVVTPTCGLAGASPSSAVAAVRTTTDLASALTDLAASFGSRAGAPTKISVDTAGWPPDLRTSADSLLFATARELLTNVTKHASATTVDVTAEFDDGRARLVVVDDGIGLPADIDVDELMRRRQAKGHIGLASRRVRIEGTGGTLSLENHPRGGTVAIVEVPAREV